MAPTEPSTNTPRPRRTRTIVALAAGAALAVAGFLAWPREAARNTPRRPATARPLPAPSASPRQPVSTPPPGQVDYFSIAYEADPHAVVAGRVPGVTVVDSAELGRPGGTRAVALLVKAGPVEKRPVRLVYLASGEGARRTIRGTNLTASGDWPRGRLGFGAVDVDGDGVREPYAVGYGGGTGMYEIELSLMHPDGRGQYTYWYSGAWADLRTRRGKFNEGEPVPGPVTRRWAHRLTETLADSIDPGAHNPEVIRWHAEEDRWVAEHGRGYHDGPMHPRWERGGMPSWLHDRCRARDGTLSWVDRVGGRVMAFDSARGRRFIVHVPERKYENALGIVVGRRYVWLGNTVRTADGFGLLAYDKRRERLVTIPIPELPTSNRGCSLTVCGGPWLSLRGGRIQGDTIDLTLPDSIDPRVEFAGATWCGM
ncbi:MAG TPA: hypothetical protein VFS20_31235 [Longimicrobium sp.]|nr:hypothetical protein [Longimicrobium sp.]